MSAWLQRIFMVNGPLKLIAFVLTLAIFIWVREDRESVVQGYVRVRIQFPEGMVLVSDPPDRLRVTVVGRWSDLNKFDASQLPAVLVEVDEETSGLVSISRDMVRTPPGLRVESIQPNYVKVDLEPAATRSVPIRPRIVGEAGDSFELGDVRVRPPRVQLTGPESSLRDVDYVWTEPIDVTDRTESFERRVQLRLDDALIQYDVDRNFTATVPILTEEVTRTIQGIGAVATNTTYATTVRPEAVTVTVRGPKPIVDRMSADSIYAAIDMTQENDRPPGRFSKQARIVNLPPGVNLVQFHPTDFLVTTERAPTEQPNPPPEPEEAAGDAGDAGE